MATMVVFPMLSLLLEMSKMTAFMRQSHEVREDSKADKNVMERFDATCLYVLLIVLLEEVRSSPSRDSEGGEYDQGRLEPSRHGGC